MKKYSTDQSDQTFWVDTQPESSTKLKCFTEEQLNSLLASERHQLKEQVLEAIGNDEPDTTAYDQERNQVRKEIKKSIEAVFEKEV